MIGYNEEADLVEYAADRGITLNLEENISLTLALDYIESRVYSGEKADSDQDLEFPRGTDTEVPDAIVKAQLVAAVIYDGGGDPMGEIGQRVVENTVAGAVSRKYSDKGNQTKLYPHLNSLLAPYLASSGTGFTVSRG